jgi:hypothetical protein
MNITPIGALGLFSGAQLKNRWTYAVPLIALLIGDLWLGFYDATVMVSVYIGFLLTAMIGRLLLSEQRTAPRYTAAVVIGALTFYLVSNIGMWYSYWPRTGAGLLACYIEGLPFLLRSLIGDALYTAILFGGFEWLNKSSADRQYAHS